MGKRAAVAAGLVVATFAVYLQVRGHDFVDLDDLQVIVWNENLRPESLGEALTLAFGTTLNANWIPLTTLSLQLDRALWGERAAGFLLGNVALHAATAVALFFALLRLTGAIGRSAFVASVFALHPLHVESVAWAAARKDPLSGLFFALGLLAYAHYVERPGTTRYLCVFACQALSLLAKPVAVCFPFVLLLLDAWPLGRLQGGEAAAQRGHARGTLAGAERRRAPARQGGEAAAQRGPARETLAGAERRRATGLRVLLVEKVPLLALSAAAAVVTLLVQGEAGAMRQAARIPLGARVLNAMDATGAYLTDAFWPSGLAVFYPHPLDALPLGRALAWGAALAGITALVLWRRRHSPWLAVGWLWFLVALAPTLGIVQVGVQARADRYTYLPLVGLALAVAWELVHRFGGRRRPLAALAAVALAAQGAAAWVQVGHWRDAVALHSHAVAVTPDNFLEHHRLARALLERGSLVEAEFHFRRSLEIEPRRSDPSVGLGDALFRQGHTDDAILAYRAALAREPGNALASAKLGLALVRAGRHREALAPLTAALAEAPQDAALHAGLARAHEALGHSRAAARHYRDALRLRPGWTAVEEDLARLRARAPGARGAPLSAPGLPSRDAD
jgi:tetratricopeptide (TPR) repeat protein